MMNHPTGRISVKGKINDRKDKDKPRREIIVDAASELNKLPISAYPFTWKPRKPIPITWTPKREGLAVRLISGEHMCEASFHRFPKEARHGAHVFIGSATTRLRDRSQSKLFNGFLQKAGLFTPDTAVELDFKRDSTPIEVHISS